MFTTLAVTLSLSGALAIEAPTVKADLDRPALVQVAARFGKGTISTGNRQRGFGNATISGGNSGTKFGNGKGSNRGNGGGHLPLQPGNGFFGSPPNKKDIPVLAPQGGGNNYGGGNYGKPPKQDIPVITSPGNGNNYGGGSYGKPPTKQEFPLPSNGNNYGAGNYGKPPTKLEPGIIIPQGSGYGYGAGNYGKPPKQEVPNGYANAPSPLKPLEPNKGNGGVIQPAPGNGYNGAPPNNGQLNLDQLRELEQKKS